MKRQRVVLLCLALLSCLAILLSASSTTYNLLSLTGSVGEAERVPALPAGNHWPYPLKDSWRELRPLPTAAC